MEFLKRISKVLSRSPEPVPVPERTDVLTRESFDRLLNDILEIRIARFDSQIQAGWTPYTIVDEIPWSESDERQKRHKELLDKWPRLYGVDRSDTVALHMSDERCLDYLDDVYTEVYLDQLSVKVME